MKIPCHFPVNPAYPIQIALRTYALALSFSLGPSLVPFIVALITKKRLSRAKLTDLKHILRRELRYDGFASAATLAVGGGATMQNILRALDGSECPGPKLSEQQKTFISNVLSSTVAFALLRSGRQHQLHFQHVERPRSNASPTLGLTILLFVRAMDVLLQHLISRDSGPKQLDSPRRYWGEHQSQLLPDKAHLEKGNRKAERLRRLAPKIDAFIFWACSARIMWCFFYQPQRLPRAYLKWIGTLANLDQRILRVLNLIRDGRWSYLRGSPENRALLMSYAMDLGHPKEWGDPLRLPSYGGRVANATWQALGVESRQNVGGIPCDVVHGRVGRVTAFAEGVALYLPVHFLPPLLTRPRSLMRPHYALSTLLAALRSATFLSTFVASYWYAVCLTRTLVLARFFPWVSHDFWDGPYGCSLAGSLLCGNSIWIENGRRRGEMALYVLPRALKTCLPGTWLREGNKVASVVERITFIISLSTLLTAATHRPGVLRGLSRWGLAFIMNGPNAGFWKRKRQSPSVPPTPTISNNFNVNKHDDA